MCIDVGVGSFPCSHIDEDFVQLFLVVLGIQALLEKMLV